MVILVSVLINPDKSFNKNNIDFMKKFLDEIINHNKGYVDYDVNNFNFNNNSNTIFHDSDSLTSEIKERMVKKKRLYELVGKLEKNYYVDDLLFSKLFTNMCEFHLIPIKGQKFILINLYNLIPNLFEIKFRNYKKIFIFSTLNQKKLYDNLIYNKKNKIYNNSKNNQEYITPKTILEKYKINNQSIKIKDVIINNVYFRILYEKQEVVKKNYMTRTFVDHLFNYYNNNNLFLSDNNNIKYIGEHFIIIYDLIEPIKLEYSLIKNIKKDNEKFKRNNVLFYLNTNYISYFLSWCKALNKNSYNIKTYSELKQSMKKFGINTHLKFFSLANIDNDEITDIIKISLLVKLIKYIFNREGIHINYNNKSKYLFEDERIGRIFFLIKCFLYTNEISPNEKNKFEEIFEKLVFYINVIFLKLKLIDDYLSLGLLNQKNINEANIYCAKNNNEEMDTLSKKISRFDSTKDFLKNIIYIARKKPFLFLSELELKLNFIINPFFKFKSSLSIESMSKKLNLNHISLNNHFDICSYVNSDELGGLILAKIIYEYEENKNKNDTSQNDSTIHIYENERESINYKNNNNIKNNRNISSVIPNFLNTRINYKNYYNHSFINEEIDDLSETKSDNNLIKINHPNKNISAKKSSLPPSPSKRTSRFLVKENSLTKWSDIKDYFFMKLPTLCYKMNLVYEEKELLYGKKNDLFIYLKDNYKIYDSSIIKQYTSEIENIFNGIYSCTGKIEQTLLHCLFYMFIIYFMFERDNKESQKINKKITEIYANGNYLLSFADLAIINLFQGLGNDSYLNSEEPYSKSVMLFLMLYGDPRGRHNDSNAIMQLPLYKVLRKTLLLAKDKYEISQYFYEIYKSLEFFEKGKTQLKKENNKTYFDYEKNIMNNINNILKISDISINKDINNNTNNATDLTSLITNYLNKDLYISQNVFYNEMLNLYKMPNYKFLSLDEISENVHNLICSKDFILYFIKQITIVLNSKYKLYDEKYINEIISENVFNLNDEKTNFYKERNHMTYNKNNKNIKEESSQTINEKEYSPSQIMKAFYQGKNLIEIFLNKDKDKDKDKIKNKLDTSVNTKRSNANSTNDDIMLKDKRDKRANHSLTKNNKKNFIFSHYLFRELLQKLSYRSNCPSGIVVSFGNNPHNETAHDDYGVIKYPLLIYKLKNVIIKKIYSGWEHNIIISDNNEIYSFGHNNNCQCGVPLLNNNIENIKIKTPINISDFNNGMTAISAACGNEHTLILDKTNNVYSFGNNEDGVLGVENNKLKSYKFIKVDFGSYNNRIKAISAGTVHNIALTDDGKIFSWGSAQGGQLGLSEKYLIQLNKKEFFISKPTLVPMKNMNKTNDMKIIKISCGEAHTVVLNNKKEVYSWGFGSNGQLGLGFCEDSFELGTGMSRSRIFTPKKIETFEKKILINDIQCGKTFSMFVDTNGGLYACGVNDLKQLGIPEPPPQTHLKNMDGQCKDFVIPTKLIYFINLKVEKISCGEAHCVAIIKTNQTYDKNVWSWGNNRYGQLGLGNTIDCSLPKPNTYLIEYKNNKFESVSCGGFHSLCLINSTDNINWIEDDFKNIICKIINDIGII